MKRSAERELGVDALAVPAGPDWAGLRRDFPILEQTVHGHPLVYFDNAATTQKPKSVLEALDRFYREDNANVHRGMHTLSGRATQAYEDSRERVARYLNADPQEVVFTRGTTEAINLVARAWGATHLNRGDVILLTEMEHHSNLVPWQMLAGQTGACLAFVPITGDEGCLDLSTLDRWLSPRVRMFAFVHVSNALGTINPVAALCERAREVGAVTLVDAAQSAGHLPVDVKAIGCDFLAFSGHKTCGPTGVGVLYGRRERLDDMPPWQGGGEMIQEVDFHSATYQAPPRRFEAGTPPIAGPVGLAVALDYLDAIGRSHLLEHDQHLARRAVEGLAGLPGLRVLGPTEAKDRAGVVSFAMEGVHAHDLVTYADQFGVALRGGHHCTQPLMRRLGLESTARASFYLYNTPQEVDRFLEVMRGAQAFFTRSGARVSAPA